MTRYNIILLIGTIVLLFGCKKEEVPFFSGKPGINFYLSQSQIDSLTYSFAYNLEELDKDTVFLRMRVMGAAADHPRHIKIEAGEGTTARAGEHYALPETYLPAGELEVDYPVVIFNTPEMLQQVFDLILDVAPSEHLGIGARGAYITPGRAVSRYKIKMTNILEQPAYWGQVQSVFGPFSQVKYRFMVRVLGMTDFSLNSIGTSGRFNYPLALRIALAEYEEENGPLIDENDILVTF